jgi:predicted transcriptional regulator
MSITEQIVLNKKGKAIAVQIPVAQYKKLMAMMEELDDIRAYKKVKKQKSKWVPAEKVFEELEKKIKQ